MYRDENDCRFEGHIYRDPLFTEEQGKPCLEIRILCKCIPFKDTRFHILLHAYGTLALQLKESISIHDKIKAKGYYAPMPVKDSNMILPKFNVSEVTIMEKKLSDFKYNYKEEE